MYRRVGDSISSAKLHVRTTPASAFGRGAVAYHPGATKPQLLDKKYELLETASVLGKINPPVAETKVDQIKIADGTREGSTLTCLGNTNFDEGMVIATVRLYHDSNEVKFSDDISGLKKTMGENALGKTAKERLEKCGPTYFPLVNKRR